MGESHANTIVIADDHAGMLEKVSEILDPEFSIRAKASDGIAALQSAIEVNPAVLILDIAMPHMDGIEVARRVRQLGIGCKIILLSVQEHPDPSIEELDASFVLKSRMFRELPLAVREAMAGRRFVSAVARAF
jgi:two-component system nitrate/nitrite response regulator NarL